MFGVAWWWELGFTRFERAAGRVLGVCVLPASSPVGSLQLLTVGGGGSPAVMGEARVSYFSKEQSVPA